MNEARTVGDGEGYDENGLAAFDGCNCPVGMKESARIIDTWSSIHDKLCGNFLDRVDAQVGLPSIVLNRTEILWGNIECLKDSSKSIKLTNMGLTTASMHLFLKVLRNNYFIAVRALMLEAGQSFDLEITANLDDCVVSKGELHMVVNEGGRHLIVPLVAKGIGTTLFCNEKIDVLDLGVQLTGNYFEKQIVLENKGHRSQQLKWTKQASQRAKDARILRAKKAYSGNISPKNASLFTVSPEKITLRAGASATFTFRGHSATPRQVSELFVLENKVDQDRFFRQSILTDVRCSVVSPLLDISLRAISFLYTWERDVPLAVQRRELTLTNTSKTKLSFTLKTDIPFSVNTREATLAPGQRLCVEINFDPGYKDDKESHIVEKFLTIEFHDHAYQDIIPLRGEVIFPNLAFDRVMINFGFDTLKNTTDTDIVRVTNTSKIEVSYEWVFPEISLTPDQISMKLRTMVPPGEVVDILPVRSLLCPGESEITQFNLRVGDDTGTGEIGGKVLCVVEGGPQYRLIVVGSRAPVPVRTVIAADPFPACLEADHTYGGGWGSDSDSAWDSDSDCDLDSEERYIYAQHAAQVKWHLKSLAATKAEAEVYP